MTRVGGIPTRITRIGRRGAWQGEHWWQRGFLRSSSRTDGPSSCPSEPSLEDTWRSPMWTHWTWPSSGSSAAVGPSLLAPPPLKCNRFSWAFPGKPVVCCGCSNLQSISHVVTSLSGAKTVSSISPTPVMGCCVSSKCLLGASLEICPNRLTIVIRIDANH